LLSVAAHLISTLNILGWYAGITDTIDLYRDTIVVHPGDCDELPEVDALTSPGLRYRDGSRTVRTSREIGLSWIFHECGPWPWNILNF